MKKFSLHITAAVLVLLFLLSAFSGCITIVELPPEESEGDPTDTTDRVTESTSFESAWSSETETFTAESTDADLTETTDEATDQTTGSATDQTTETTADTTTDTTADVTTETTADTATETTTADGTAGGGGDDPDLPARPIRIYVDQGHNPHSFNTGAQGNGLREENITYAVGIALAELLSADPRFEVRLSRPTADTLLGTNNSESLQARCDDANSWAADYFVSIHVNSFTTETAHGIEAYAYSESGEAYLLGNGIVDSLVAATGFAKRGMKVNPNLHVLRHTQMPAVLVEIGFISNPTEAALMASDPALFASGIYSGISTYFQNYQVDQD